MRKTSASVLCDVFPEHVCNTWLGHSQAIANKHYRKVLPEQLARATGKSTSTENVPSYKTVYQYNNQGFESSYPEDFDFCDTPIVSGYQSSPEKNIYLYEALQKMGPGLAKFFAEECGDFCLDGLIGFCAEYGFPLPEITTNFTTFSSAESIVLYEVLQYLGPDFVEFYKGDFGGDMTLENVCFFCATHGISTPCVTMKEIRNDLESSEKLVENSVNQGVKKAPRLGLSNEENGRTWSLCDTDNSKCKRLPQFSLFRPGQQGFGLQTSSFSQGTNFGA